MVSTWNEMKKTTMTRRDAIQRAGLATAVCAFGSTIWQPRAQTPAVPAVTSLTGPFQLAPLPYPVDALEPYVDAKTMEIHHGKHHAAYVQNLNKAVAEFPELAGKTIELLLKTLPTVPEKIRAAVRNHGGGHANHTLFWSLLKRNESGRPRAKLAKAIESKFGSYDNFRQEFAKAAMGVFGSGWAWVTIDADGPRIETTPNQDSPLTANRAPILGIDVWEHAYYLKYQNRRADYVAAFFNIIDWDRVAELFESQAAILP